MEWLSLELLLYDGPRARYCMCGAGDFIEVLICVFLSVILPLPTHF